MNILVAAVVLLFLVSLALSGSFFLLIVLAAIAGAMLGLGAIYLRSDRGLGAAEIGERAPDHAGQIGVINMAHIPVMGIGGLGLVAIAIIVGLTLPEGRRLLSWGLAGAIVGAASLIAWRHHHRPFTTEEGDRGCRARTPGLRSVRTRE